MHRSLFENSNLFLFSKSVSGIREKIGISHDVRRDVRLNDCGCDSINARKCCPSPLSYATVIVALQMKRLRWKALRGGSRQEEVRNLYALPRKCSGCIYYGPFCVLNSGYLRFIIKVIVAIYGSEILRVRFVHEFFSNNLCYA